MSAIPAIIKIATPRPLIIGPAIRLISARDKPVASRPRPNDFNASPNPSIFFSSAPIISTSLKIPTIPSIIIADANRPTTASGEIRATRANEPANTNRDLPTSPSIAI